MALLGRNRPVGIALAALLFAFLDRAAGPAADRGIPSSVVTIIQGTIVLAVVIANEIARRMALPAAERAARPAHRPSRRRRRRHPPIAGRVGSGPATDRAQEAQA